jgi:cellulose synthase operon protein C
VPCTSSPPMIVLGEPLLRAPSEQARVFLILRALKLVQARASALVRAPAADMAVLVAAWLTIFNPQWRPEGMNPAAITEAARRVYAGLPRQMPPDVGVIALDVAGSIGTQGAALGTAAISWANRMALLAVGDPGAAFEAIAWSMGMADGAPLDPQERIAWATRTLEIKDLVSFSVTDAYAEARARLGLDRT